MTISECVSRGATVQLWTAIRRLQLSCELLPLQCTSSPQTAENLKRCLHSLAQTTAAVALSRREQTETTPFPQKSTFFPQDIDWVMNKNWRKWRKCQKQNLWRHKARRRFLMHKAYKAHKIEWKINRRFIEWPGKKRAGSPDMTLGDASMQR